MCCACMLLAMIPYALQVFLKFNTNIVMIKYINVLLVHLGICLYHIFTSCFSTCTSLCVFVFCYHAALQAKSNDLKPGAKGGRDSPALAAPGSRSASPAPGKLAKGTFKGKSKAGAGQTEEPAAKKKKPLPPSGAVPAPVNTAAAKASKDDVVTEEAVRRYLSRKPMTTKDLLKKFKGKTSMDGEQLVTALGEILRKINPDRAKVRDQVLLSIKA